MMMPAMTQVPVMMTIIILIIISENFSKSPKDVQEKALNDLEKCQVEIQKIQIELMDEMADRNEGKTG